MEEKYLTVSQLNRYIKFRLDNDANLNTVFLKGEISNFKAHTRGHYYFTLKDEASRINAVMFQGNTKQVKFVPVDGMKVMIVGHVSVYEASGGYQVYVQEMIEDGVGNLALEFEKLKKKLAAEGLFDPKYKKAIPKLPKRIGVVTAETGAAIKDILTTIKRRWPIAEVLLFPSLVQGANASLDIVRQIERAEGYDIDTLIVGRGGGSIEDLWPFNEEIVARAIFKCPIPVISAVGHEIDFTIADFIADLRAPTPTAAAELAVPDKNDFYNHLKQIIHRLKKSLAILIKMYDTRLRHIQENYILKNPMNIYLVKEEKFDRVLEQVKNTYTRNISKHQEHFLKIRSSFVFSNPEFLYKEKKKDFLHLKEKVQDGYYQLNQKKQQDYLTLLGKLEVLNPLLTIQRGYSIARVKDKVVGSIKDIQKGDMLEIEVRDGTIQSKVI